MLYSDAIIEGSSEKSPVKVHFFERGSGNQTKTSGRSTWRQTEQADGTVTVTAIENGVTVLSVEGRGGEVTQFEVLGKPRAVTESNILIAKDALYMFKQDIRDGERTQFATDIGQCAGERHAYGSFDDFNRNSVATPETMATRPGVTPTFPAPKR